jgi:uncharacterized membrane protein
MINHPQCLVDRSVVHLDRAPRGGTLEGGTLELPDRNRAWAGGAGPVVTPRQGPARYPELDLLRTLAIVGMVVYHTAFNLNLLYHWDIAVYAGGWRMLQRLVCSLFLLLVGAGVAISLERSSRPERLLFSSPWSVYRRYLKRGLGILLWGMVITIVTAFLYPRSFVRFGILHAIGTSVLLLPLLARLKEWNALVGTVILVATNFLPHQANTSLLVPLGIIPPGFQSIDYFPILPWFGIVLIGYAVGYCLYVRRTAWRRYLPGMAEPTMRMVTAPGRHSLLIYLLHQPILLVMLAAIHGRLHA